MEFREFVNLYEKIQVHANPRSDMNGGAWGQLGARISTGPFGAMPTQWTGSQWPDDALYSGGFMGSNWVNGKFDLGLPNVSSTGKISFIDKKSNPILIMVGNKTKLYMPYDAFRKINVPPEVGRTLMVTFQRRTDDTSPVPSKIQSIKCY